MAWACNQLPARGRMAAFLVGGLLLFAIGCQKQDPTPPPPPGRQAGEDDSAQATTPAPRPTYPANRLAEQASPYLQRHAHDGVEWYPWGEEAFAKAQEENKPILLAVGYTGCERCYVLQQETFLNEEVARFANENYVCVVVDREERPEIDLMCRTVLPIFAQNVDWPICMFLTPQGVPYGATTVLPPHDPAQTDLPSLLDLLKLGAQQWRDEETLIREGTQKMIARFEDQQGRVFTHPAFMVGPDLPRRVLSDLSQGFDPEYGGFYYSPANPQLRKLPSPPFLKLLAWQAAHAGESQPLTMLVTTLSNMARGGIHDHVGGGFHLESTDRYWRIPAFEKTLYDNGLLAAVYAQAYELTVDENYRQVAEDTCDFVLRDMTSPQGGFYSVLDGGGAYYLWSSQELAEVLSAEYLEVAGAIYGFAGEPNFEGKYLPVIPKPLGEIAADLNMTEAELRARQATINELLQAARAQRAMPPLDTKILTDWNGLMIRGLVEAGRALEQPAYTEAAARAADFLLTHCRDEAGGLYHVYAGDEAYVPGLLNDYAFFVDGLIALHQATGEERWLTAADELTALQIELFYDQEEGGFYPVSNLSDEIIRTEKDFYDGLFTAGIPAGNSLAVGNLVYLSQQLERPEYLKAAGETVHASGVVLDFAPIGAAWMVVEALGWKDAVGEPGAEEVETQPAPRAVQNVAEPVVPAGP